MLIRAVVHARLFGLRLLTLDARVVVAETDPAEPALDAVVGVDPAVLPLAGAHAPHGGRRAVPEVRALRRGTTAGPDGGVGRARDLLADSADTLAVLRRPGR